MAGTWSSVTCPAMPIVSHTTLKTKPSPSFLTGVSPLSPLAHGHRHAELKCSQNAQILQPCALKSSYADSLTGPQSHFLTPVYRRTPLGRIRESKSKSRSGRGAVSTSALGAGSGENEGTLGPSGAATESTADEVAGSREEKEEGLGEGSPRRSIGVQFTCNKCKEQSTRYVNPLALTKGTIFLQCANSACKAIHKIVDNLNLIEEINYKEEDEKRRKEEEEKEKKGRAAGA